MKLSPHSRDYLIKLALAELNRRLAKGHEFPDACYASAALHGLTSDTLRRAYDAAAATA